MKLSRNYLLITISVVVATLLFTLLLTMDVGNPESVLDSRLKSSYGYFTSIFVYNDVELANSSYQYKSDAFFFRTGLTTEGKQILEESYVNAFLLSPFLFNAHLISEKVDSYQSGYSTVYMYFVLSGLCFYSMCGLLNIKYLLRNSSKNFQLFVFVVSAFIYYLLVLTKSQISFIFDLFLFSALLRCLTLNLVKLQHYLFIGVLFGFILLNSKYYSLVVFTLLWLYLKNQTNIFTVAWFKYSMLLIFGVVIAYIPQFIYWNSTLYSYKFPSFVSNGLTLSDTGLFLPLTLLVINVFTIIIPVRYSRVSGQLLTSCLFPLLVVFQFLLVYLMDLISIKFYFVVFLSCLMYLFYFVIQITNKQLETR